MTRITHGVTGAQMMRESRHSEKAITPAGVSLNRNRTEVGKY